MAQRDALSIMAIIVRNGIGDTSSNPGQVCLCSQNANALEKSMNPSLLHPAMSK